MRFGGDIVGRGLLPPGQPLPLISAMFFVLLVAL